jgi:L-iditol 2-dehydrogenase
MRALAYRGPGELRLEERPDPEPGPGEAVLAVAACGLCGTDLRIEAGKHRAYGDGEGRVPGHEIAGTIAAVGAGLGLAEGTAAFVAPNVGCGVCRSCLAGRVNLCERPQALGITRDGGFAERLLLGADVIEQGNVLAVADGIDLAALALAEPLACALRGSAAVSIDRDEVVLIVGAGPIGLMHLLVAALAEPAAILVSEPSAERRAEAARFGATRTVDAEAEDLAQVVGDASDGRGADVVITAAPAAAAQAQALELAAPGGRINFFGGLPRDRSRVELDTNLIHYKELVVTGTTANTTEDCRRAVELITGGEIDTGALIGARVALADAERAFETARSGRVMKVVVEP